MVSESNVIKSNIDFINFIFFLGKINPISSIVLKSIKAFTITEYTVLQDYS